MVDETEDRQRHVDLVAAQLASATAAGYSSDQVFATWLEMRKRVSEELDGEWDELMHQRAEANRMIRESLP